MNAYPLSWPSGWKRTQNPQRSRFGEYSTAQAVNEVLDELRQLGAKNVVVSTNYILRNDGLPRSGQAQPRDTGVAVYFDLSKKPRVLACDRWHKVEHNLHAIAMHIAALRGQNRWGVGTIEQAFTGYAALPEPKQGLWWQVLGLQTNAVSEVEINAAWRRLAFENHPDRGGSNEAMAQINKARDDGLRMVS